MAYIAHSKSWVYYLKFLHLGNLMKMVYLHLEPETNMLYLPEFEKKNHIEQWTFIFFSSNLQITSAQLILDRISWTVPLLTDSKQPFNNA